MQGSGEASPGSGRSTSPELGIHNSQNQYFYLEGEEWRGIPSHTEPRLGFGRDYHAEILRILDRRGVLSGLTFYLSKETPLSLPSYGNNVVLVVVGDEHYRWFPYFRNILAILRSYGPYPHYLDAFPNSFLKVSALFLFLFKRLGYIVDRWRSSRFSGRDVLRKTLHVPLGCFGIFEPAHIEFSSRRIDYAFLGSIDQKIHPWYSPLGLIQPPKLVARNKMMTVLQQFAANDSRWKGRLTVTGRFDDSIGNEETYLTAMADCKISICPRGSNPETYRFYESLKAGCVVVCEALPETWFYQGHPGIVIDDWNEMPGILDNLLSDPVRLQELSSSGRQFWMSRLAETAVAVKVEEFLQTMVHERGCQ